MFLTCKFLTNTSQTKTGQGKERLNIELIDATTYLRPSKSIRSHHHLRDIPSLQPRKGQYESTHICRSRGTATAGRVAVYGGVV